MKKYFRKIEKVHVALLVFLLILFMMIAGCTKVGEEDPALSFRSRKARLVNNWVLTHIYQQDNERGINGSVLLKVKKDHTYMMIEEEDGGQADTTYGEWAMDPEQEDRLQLVENFNTGKIFKLLRLANDEMWWTKKEGIEIFGVEVDELHWNETQCSCLEE